MSKLGLWFGITVMTATLVGGIANEVLKWTECRAVGHSWFYCAHLTGP